MTSIKSKSFSYTNGVGFVRIPKDTHHQLRIIMGIYNDAAVADTIGRILGYWLDDHPDVPRAPGYEQPRCVGHTTVKVKTDEKHRRSD